MGALAAHSGVCMPGRCDGGNAEVVQILLAAQADVNIPDMFNKDTPLHLACEAGHVDVVRILLENRGHVNAQDQMNGETPLHLACEAGHSDIVQLLLEYGADASIENVYRKRALHYADSSTLEVMQSRDQGGRGGDISDGSIARDDVGYDATLSLESKSPPERLPGGLELEEPRGRAEELTCDGKEEMNLINNVLSGGLKVAESVDEEVEDDDLITALEDEGPTRALEASEGDSWYAVHSMAGRASDGRDKQNQDAFIISTQLGGDPNMALFGVFDGHGRNGHLVAYFAKSVLPGIISRDIASLRSAARDEQGSLQDEGARQRRLASLSSGIVANILSAAFTTLQQMLEEQEKFDCQSSGSTALLALVAYGTLYTANVGDSRAIVARLSSHDSSRERDGDREQLTVVPMSEDQVPNVSEERRRIEQQGGLVRRDQDPLTGEQGPFRVWRRDLAGPGLAMSRSIGDVSAHQIGVSALPVVMEYPLARQDRLLVLATDGVWDMLDNSEGIDIAARASGDGQGEPGFAARLVCETARRAWEFKETRIDDITCLLVFLPLVQDSPDVGLLPQTEAAEVAVDRFSVHVPAPHIGDYTVFNDEGLSQGARADGFHVAGDYGSRTGENVCHDGAILMRGLHSQPARAPYEPPHRTTHW